MNEKLEFLSRQHVDFKTIEGMKQLIQAVTWRAKIEEIGILGKEYAIYVRKKKIPEVRRLAKDFGISGIKYHVWELGWKECWFKRFRYFENQIQGVKINQWCACDHGFVFPNRIIHIDPASKDGDYLAKATFEKKIDGSIELVDLELEKPKPTPKFTSIGEGKSVSGEPFYFINDLDNELEVDQTIILNGKALKVKTMVRMNGKPLTRITIKHI